MTIQDAKEILEKHGLTVDQTDTATLTIRDAYRDRFGNWQDDLVVVYADGTIYCEEYVGSILGYLGY